MDALTYPDALELLAYWGAHPPTHVTLGAIVQGLAGKSSEPTRAHPPTLEELQSVVDQFKR